jgi:hypothetical protein
MLRRIALASFALAVAFVVACGHDVTPIPIGEGNLAGKVVVTFRTTGPMDLINDTYAIVIDTCGEGTPHPNVYGGSFDGYSYAFLIGGTSGQSLPVLEQFILGSDQQNALNPQIIGADPNFETFTPNYEGLTNQFQLIFARAQLDNPDRIAQPCPNITPTPKTGAAPSSASSASAASSATSAPSAAASPIASSMPTTAAQVDWYVNFFTLDTAARTVLDSLGEYGVSDTIYPSPTIDTQVTRAYPVVKTPGGTGGPTTATQIEGGEIDNYQ